MKNLSIINKFIYFINSICLILLILSYTSPFISPRIFWPISFIGLIFPVLFITNMLFLGYWLIKLKKQVFANIIILLIGINYMDLFIGTEEKKTIPENSKTTKVISYNVRLFNRNQWIPKANIREKIFNFLNHENADILCIQEFYTSNQIPTLNYKYQYVGEQNKNNQWHMAIYSQYPQINKGTVSIKGEKMNNTCIYSDIIIQKDTIRIYNIHLASNWFKESDYSFIENPQKEKIGEGIKGIIKRMTTSYKKRSEEVDVIKLHIKNSRYPIIICGDFNDTPMSYAYKNIINNMQDSFSESGLGLGQTFVKIPALRIDYILHDKKFKSFNYTEHKIELSDHYPISTEIIIP